MQVDIFRTASRRSKSADVLVAPEYQTQFERLLTVNAYHFDVIVEDMQRLVFVAFLQFYIRNSSQTNRQRTRLNASTY